MLFATSWRSIGWQVNQLSGQDCAAMLLALLVAVGWWEEGGCAYNSCSTAFHLWGGDKGHATGPYHTIQHHTTPCHAIPLHTIHTIHAVNNITLKFQDCLTLDCNTFIHTHWCARIHAWTHAYVHTCITLHDATLHSVSLHCIAVYATALYWLALCYVVYLQTETQRHYTHADIHLGAIQDERIVCTIFFWILYWSISLSP